MSTDAVRGDRWFGFLLGHAVLVQLLTFVLRPTSTYRALELGVPAVWLGVLSASFAIFPVFLALPAGQAVDRIGERRVLVVGAIVMAAAVGVYVVGGSSVAGLIVGTALLGVGQLCSVVGEQALVANRASVTRYDATFGHYTFATAIGQAIGPGLIILFGGDQPIPDTGTIFLVTSVPAAALVLVTFFLRSSSARRGARSQQPGALGTLLRQRGIVSALVVSCLVLASLEVLTVYLPALGAERGIVSGVIGMLLTVRAVASMISRFFLGRLVDLLGRRRLLIGGLVLSGVGIIASAIPMPIPVLVAVMVVVGITLGSCQPLTMAWLAEAAPAGLRGRAMSLRLTGNRIGQFLLPSAAGLVAASSGAGGVLVAMGLALGLAGFAGRGIRDSTPPREPG